MSGQPVLAAIDGSPISLAAAHWSAEEAGRRGAPLTLLHVWPRPVGVHLEQLQADGAALLERARQEVASRHPGVDIRTRLLGTSTVDGLVDAAAGGDLLVLGARGRGGFEGLLLGSVSLAVAGRCPVPVVVLRPESSTEPGAGHRPGDVVVGVGERESAEAVLGFAFGRAAERGSRVVAVHGWDVPAVWAAPGMIVAPFDSTVLRGAAEERLAVALAPWREKYPQVGVVARAETGGGAKALVSASSQAEVVVLGRRMPHHAIGGHHLGHTAHAVLHHAKAPVVVVPHR